MATLSLKCRCGEVSGSATDVTPASGTRVVCCCSDCQAFAVYLGAESDTLDEFGGTEIFQPVSYTTSPSPRDKRQSRMPSSA